MIKHCLLYSYLTLLAACLAVPSVFAMEAPAVETWLGEWINTDANTRSTTKLKIHRVDGKLVAQGFGKCHPTDCDWGTTPLYLSVGTDGAEAVIGLASWDHGFKKHHIVARLRSGKLIVESTVIYKDESGRANRSYTETFARKTTPVRRGRPISTIKSHTVFGGVIPIRVPEPAVANPTIRPHLATVNSKACEQAVQGKIAWNYSGNKQWTPKSIARLCHGAKASVEPARCFERVMHGGLNWGDGTRWEWQNAVDLCEGTWNASATISCFEAQKASGTPWMRAIDACTDGFENAREPASIAPPIPETTPWAMQLPAFPWPPPRSSAFEVIPAGLVTNQGEITLLRDVNKKLIQALAASGYVERSYYAVPDGFALVTRLEQINPDGTPKEHGRWSIEVESLHSFSLTEYLEALFFADPGLFRVIVFVVTPHPFSQSEANIDRDEALTWLTEGLNTLPSSVATQEYTDRFSTTALIYVFEQLGSEDASLKTPGELTGRIHLDRSGFLIALQG